MLAAFYAQIGAYRTLQKVYLALHRLRKSARRIEFLFKFPIIAGRTSIFRETTCGLIYKTLILNTLFARYRILCCSTDGVLSLALSGIDRAVRRHYSHLAGSHLVSVHGLCHMPRDDGAQTMCVHKLALLRMDWRSTASASPSSADSQRDPMKRDAYFAKLFQWASCNRRQARVFKYGAWGQTPNAHSSSTHLCARSRAFA